MGWRERAIQAFHNEDAEARLRKSKSQRAIQETVLKQVALQDMETWGYGLDKIGFYLQCAILVGFGIFFGIYISWQVQNMHQANKHEFELSEIEKLLKVGGPDSTNDLYEVPLPHLAICLPMAPNVSFVPFPEKHERVTFYPNGFNPEAELTREHPDEVHSGEFVVGHEEYDGFPADSYYKGFNVELIGPDGKQLSELRPQAIFRVQLYTIRRTHFTPNELLHEPTSPAVVYLVERDHGEVDLTDPDSPICSDFSGRNVTVMSPEGAWLIKYREREHFEKDEEHEEEFLMYKDYEIESASQLDDSHVMDVSELIGAPAWDEYYAKLETENPALKALIDDNPDGLRQWDIYIQYGYDMTRELTGLRTPITGMDLFNALSGVASLGLAVTANVVVFVLSLLRKYYAAQEKKLMQEMHQAEEEAHSDV